MVRIKLWELIHFMVNKHIDKIVDIVGQMMIGNQVCDDFYKLNKKRIMLFKIAFNNNHKDSKYTLLSEIKYKGLNP